MGVILKDGCGPVRTAPSNARKDSLPSRRADTILPVHSMCMHLDGKHILNIGVLRASEFGRLVVVTTKF
jgi:hypothetical protein